VIGVINQAPQKASDKPEWTLADSWIWARLQSLVRDAERLFTTHQYGEAGRLIYEFFWSEFADWYVEIAKLQIRAGGDRAYYTASNMVRIFDTCLRLLHPFTPFVTEELWGLLKKAASSRSDGFSPKTGWEEALIIARWPEATKEEDWESQKILEFGLVQDIVKAIRNLRAEKKIPPSTKIPALLVAGERLRILESQKETIAFLANLDSAHFGMVKSKKDKPKGHVSQVVSGVEIFLPIEDLVDQDAEKNRLEKELAEVQSQVERLEKLLSSSFAEKAPDSVVSKERVKLATYKETALKILEQLK